MIAKKWLCYLAGIATGICLTIAIGVVIMVINDQYDNSSKVTEESYNRNSDNSKEIVKYREQAQTRMLSGSNEIPGRIINEKSFEVFQVLTPAVALVRGQIKGGYYYGNIYLLVNELGLINGSDFEFYDGQIVNVKKNEEVRMYGTYKYTTTDGMLKTVPRIRIENKE